MATHFQTISTLFVCVCIVVILYDILFRRVSNRLLLTAGLVHVGWLAFFGHGLGGIDPWQSLLGGAIGFALFIPLYALRAMGAGDVKFFALLGFMMGPQYLIPLWLIGSVLAGVHAAVWYVSTRSPVMASTTWQRIQGLVVSSHMYRTLLERRAGRRGIPYAAYLAIAAIFIWVG